MVGNVRSREREKRGHRRREGETEKWGKSEGEEESAAEASRAYRYQKI
jgi:hypothetical protein